MALENRLTALQNDLAAEKNLLLEARRAERESDYEPRPQTRRLPSGSLTDVPEDDGLVHLSARRPCGAWRLELVVPKGIQLLQLRKTVFRCAQESCAYYSRPIDYDLNFDTADLDNARRSIDYVDTTAESDLVADLYFKSVPDAENFRTYVTDAMEIWHGEPLPAAGDPVWHCDEQLTYDRRVWKGHYNPNESPNRHGVETIDRAESVSSDGTTTVLTDPEVIRLESWIDPKETHQQFHECHIDESIKRTAARTKAIREGKSPPYPEEDTAGNKVPLPIDWHYLYDKKAADKPTYISFVAVELPADDPPLEAQKHNGDTYVPLQVDIYFHPDLCDGEITSLLRPAKNPKHVNGRIYRVHIFKREPGMFIRKTAKRHADTIRTWP